MSASSTSVQDYTALQADTAKLNTAIQADRVALYTLLNLPEHKDDLDAQIRFHPRVTDEQKKETRDGLVPLYVMLDAVQKLGDQLNKASKPDLSDPVYKALAALDETRKTQLMERFTGALDHLHPQTLETAKAANADDRQTLVNKMSHSLDAIVRFSERHRGTISALAPAAQMTVGG